MNAVVFEGCACRAAYHAGVAAELAAAGVPLGLAAGASSGSIIAAGLAAGLAHELPERWLALAGRSVVSLRRIFKNRTPFDMGTIVGDTLRSALGHGDLRDRPVEALATATRVRGLARRLYSSREEPDFIPPVLGSCFLPVFYGRRVRVRGEWIVDGGLTDNLPVEAVVDRGARVVFASVIDPQGTAFKSPRRRRHRPEAEGHVRVLVIHPERPLAVGSWDFDPGRTRAAIEQGREAAKRALDGFA